jgi:hypothetical protein
MKLYLARTRWCGFIKTPPKRVGPRSGKISVVNDWVEVGVGYYHKETISRCSYSIEIGVPAAAFAALEELLKDEVKG